MKEAKTYPSSSNNRRAILSARSGLRSVLKYHRDILNKNSHILMPAYIGWSPNEGSGLMDPVKQEGFTYSFYPVTESLQPVHEKLEELLEAFPQCVILVVHYFGIQSALSAYSSEIVDGNSCTLIEDFAHDLSSINQLTNFDINKFSIFSCHKWIASNGGGFITSHPKNLEKIILEQMQVFDAEVYMNTDLHTVFQKRWENFRYLDTRLNNLKKLKKFKVDDGNMTCPLNLPMLALNADVRHGLYGFLSSTGFQPTSLYHHLTTELNEVEFPTSFEISRTIVNLPVHQDYMLEQMEALADLLIEWDIS
jgi:dTDP-4-amino-4,6-dideoxygalactose transaminase